VVEDITVCVCPFCHTPLPLEWKAIIGKIYRFVLNTLPPRIRNDERRKPKTAHHMAHFIEQHRYHRGLCSDFKNQLPEQQEICLAHTKKGLQVNAIQKRTISYIRHR
jgi:hypothetical protein